jgi:hypothetical protein
MLCCQGFEVKNYDFTLGRLAYKSLRLAQDSSNCLVNAISMLYK